MKRNVIIIVAMVLITAIAILLMYANNKLGKENLYIYNGNGSNTNDEGISVLVPKKILDFDMKNRLVEYITFLITYQNKTYAAIGLGTDKISYEEGLKLRGEKLGVTKNYKNPNDDPNAFDSNMLINYDVYSLKGYDPSFRIMTVGPLYDGGNDEIVIFESLEGHRIKNGEYVSNLLDLKDQTISVKSRKLVDGEPVFKDMDLKTEYPVLLDVFNSSYAMLNDFSKYKDVESRIVYIKLKEGTSVSLIIYKNGYIEYSFQNGVMFKVTDPTKFAEVYKILE